MNDIYYRVYQSHKTGKFTVVCMHWFDEYDYSEDRFAKDIRGDRLIFSTEKEAKRWLNNNIDPNLIDTKYKTTRFKWRVPLWLKRKSNDG